jgi:hypothetical protein
MTHRVDTEDKMENVINESLTSPRWQAPYAAWRGGPSLSSSRQAQEWIEEHKRHDERDGHQSESRYQRTSG